MIPISLERPFRCSSRALLKKYMSCNCGSEEKGNSDVLDLGDTWAQAMLISETAKHQ